MVRLGPVGNFILSGNTCWYHKLEEPASVCEDGRIVVLNIKYGPLCGNV